VLCPAKPGLTSSRRARAHSGRLPSGKTNSGREAVQYNYRRARPSGIISEYAAGYYAFGGFLARTPSGVSPNIDNKMAPGEAASEFVHFCSHPGRGKTTTGCFYAQLKQKYALTK
jgi:hypothetical protein